VRADSVEWHDFDDHLRVLGPIEAGTDMGRHHTLVLRPDGMEVVVQKRGALQGWQLRLVEEAVAGSTSPQVLLLAIDDAEAQFAVLTPRGLKVLGALPANIPGKRHAGALEAKARFYEEAQRSVKLFRVPPSLPFVVVGPGWWRDEFLDHVRQREPALAAGAISEGTSQGGRVGLTEAIRRGVAERVAADHRVAVETRLVDEAWERIAAGKPVAYGPAAVRQAIAAGAIETLLVTDQLARSGQWDADLRAAEQGRARLTIVSTAHEAGVRLAGLGGAAALLRFAL
jgi:protein pelota